MASIALPSGPTNIIFNQFENPPSDQKQTDALSYVDDKKGNHDLPEELKKELKGLLTHYGTVVDKLARRYEVVDVRRQRFYDRGYQYIYFNWGSYVFIPITAGQVMNVGSDSVQMPRYCNVYNIFKPYRRNFSATLSQNPPGVNFEPKRASNSLDIKAAAEAQKYSDYYDTVNNLKKIQTKTGRLFWTDGRVVFWTRHEKNAEKWGTYQEAEDEALEAIDRMTTGQDAQMLGVAPETLEDEANTEDQDEADEQAMLDKARGEEITTLHGVLEAKCFPITANDQDELLGVILSDDPPIEKLKEKYFWMAEEIKAGESGFGESAFERNARLGVLQGMKVWAQSNDAYNHLGERKFMFLRKAAFNHASDENKVALKRLFPKGVRVTFAGGEYAESFNVSLDDQLTVDHCLDGDGMNRPSWGRDHMPVQDAFNNYKNMGQEWDDYSIPATYFDQRIMDGQAQRERISQPGEFVGVTDPEPGGGPGGIARYFYTPEPVSRPAEMTQAEQDLRDSLSQLITGVQPSLFGGQIAKDDRVGVYQMAREQAMGVMGMPWGVIQAVVARCKEQAALEAAKVRREEDKIQFLSKKKGSRKRKPMSVSIADLRKGNFRAVPDSDSSFPATRTMRKQAFQEAAQYAEFNPMMAEAMQQPDNMELGAQLEGLPELDIPAARACDRQRDEIDQLLETGPIPPSREQVAAAELKAGLLTAATASAQGQKAGPLPPEQQGPTDEQWNQTDDKGNPNFISSGAWLDNPLMLSMAKPSVEVDELDFHQYHRQQIKDWFNSDERDKAMDAGNRLGIANIRLHDKQHEKFMEAEAAKAQPNPAMAMMAAMAAKRKGPQAGPGPAAAAPSPAGAA